MKRVFSYTIEVPDALDERDVETQLRGAFNEDKIDLPDWTCTEVSVEKPSDRKKFHDALDKMLDVAEVGGYDLDDVILTVKKIVVETPTESETTEDISEFVTEFASGEIEEQFVDHRFFVNGGEKNYQRLNLD